jgi:hypothetical protein
MINIEDFFHFKTPTLTVRFPMCAYVDVNAERHTIEYICSAN